MKKVIAIIGARPQFIKHAPLEIASKGNFELITIHTGQHYDDNMSKVFFDELKMTPPVYQLSLGGGSHGIQTGNMLIEIEKILIKEKPDGVLVYGDTNSTLAGALAASKLHIPLIHVEAGLRSFNKDMPEEVNRILTDHVSTILFAPTDDAISNLNNEGIQKGVYRVGDIMCDMSMLAKEYLLSKQTKKMTDLDKYYLATIHRPYNTDVKERIECILTSFDNLNHPVIFPIHPRTSKMLEDFGLKKDSYKNIIFMEPIGYFDVTSLLLNSQGLITDSGGMQKEAYNLEKQCVTIRSETEWTETLINGWNTLVFELQEIEGISTIFGEGVGDYQNHLYGDGNSAKDIVDKIINTL